MPWTAKDATRHQKLAKTDKLKKMWASTANSVLSKCLSDGGEKKKCEGKAVRIANSAVAKNVQENEMNNGEWTMASVAQTAIEVGLAVARETEEIANGEAAKTLDLLRSKWSELGESAAAPVIDVAHVEVGGEQVVLSEIIEFYRAGKAAEREEEMAASVTVEQDKTFPLDASQQVKLLIEASKLIDRVLCGIDDAAEAIEEQEPDTESKDDDTEVTVEIDEPAIEEPLIEFDEGESEQGELDESGHVLAIIEDGDGTRSAPLKMHVEVIRPGMGNAKMKRYYSAPMLRENAHMFKGAKMYPVNHRKQDKSVGNEVSMVLDCPVGFTERGGPIALVGVFDETFARNVRNRAALSEEALNSLECSILGEGDMRKGKVNGKQAYIVENISKVESIDWVTKAGAGGRALEIVENDEDGGINMTEERVEEVVEEPVVEDQVTETEVEGTEPQQDVVEIDGEVQEALIAEAVAEEVDKTSLPEAFKNALKVREYADADELAGAITQATDDFKAATGSGKPFGQGPTKQGTSVANGDLSPKERKLAMREYYHEKVLPNVGIFD